MYFLQSGIPFVRILLLFVLGMILAIYLSAPISQWILLIPVALFVLFYILGGKNLFSKIAISLCAYLALVSFGYAVQRWRSPAQDAEFVGSLEKIDCYIGKVESSSVGKNKKSRLQLSVEAYHIKSQEWEKTTANILIYISADSSGTWQEGDRVVVQGHPQAPIPPPNPEQFDYKSYLARKGIQAIQFCKIHQVKKIGHSSPAILISLANTVHQKCLAILRTHIHGENEYALASALLLGSQTEMDEKLYQAYSATGTVHALAVSGLHVSLLYTLLLVLFGFIKKKKYGSYYVLSIVLPLLWFYALVTGFSPSVVRAVAMFTVFLIASTLKRRTSMLNTLSFSGLFLLCLYPSWLLEIGFQFSFLAVLGIVLLHPVVNAWWKPSSIVVQKIWELVSLSLVAQLAVAPLSVYYFHSFPLLFLPFNLVIVPLSTLALYAGIAALILSWIDVVASIFYWIAESLLWLMNALVAILDKEFLTLDFIPLDALSLVLLYGIILAAFVSIRTKKIKMAYTSLLLLLVLLLKHSFKGLYTEKPVITVYRHYREEFVSIVYNGDATVYSARSMDKYDKAFRYAAYNHLSSLGIKAIRFEKYQDIPKAINPN